MALRAHSGSFPSSLFIHSDPPKEFRRAVIDRMEKAGTAITPDSTPGTALSPQ